MSKVRWIALLILPLIVLTQLALPVTASAEDATPPAPTEEPVATEETVTTQEPAVESESASTSLPEADPTETPEIDTPAEVILSAPEGVDVVVLDENSEALPLASEEAVEVLAAPDPYFTVSGTIYRWLATAGACAAYPLDVCFDGTSTPIQDAIYYLSQTLITAPDDGNIYVEAGTYDESVIVQGSFWTLAGSTTPSYLGLIGVAGSGTTTIDGSVDIQGMNDFTLSGFTIFDDDGSTNPAYLNAVFNTGLLTLNDLVVDNDFSGSGGNQFGISVALHSGDIRLTGVSADDNIAYGANLDNSAGSGSVFVDDSSFGKNGEEGLMVYSKGNITVTNSSAIDNDGQGGYFSNGYSGATGGITVAASHFQNNNLGGSSSEGLVAMSNGNISLSDVSASYNFGNGAFLYNAWSGATGSIWVDNSYFQFNGDDAASTQGTGLSAYSHGDISLSNVFAQLNFGSGAYLDNFSTGGTGNIWVDNSYFQLNGYDTPSTTAPTVGDGLIVYSNGNIGLSDSYAQNNFGHGAWLYNFNPTSGIWVDTSYFQYNGGQPGSVSGQGLIANSYGDISVSNVFADHNFDHGASLVNTFGGGSIWVSASVFNENGYDDPAVIIAPTVGNGLQAFSRGNISLSGVTANQNSLGIGAGLSNQYIGSAGNIWVDPSTFDNNGISGVFAYSNGDITLEYVTANGNGASGGDSGAFLDTAANAGICNSTFNSNTDYGVEAYLPGTLTLNNVSFSGNTTNDYGGSFGSVVIDSSFDCTTAPPAPLNPFFLSGGGGGGGGRDRKINISSPSLPLNEVRVSGGEGVGLDCAAFRGTVLILPNGDTTLFPCPITDTASLASLGADALPGPLPDGNTFGSAFTAGIEKNGSAVSTLDSSITLSFVIPDGMSEPLAILFWDGSAWVELSGRSTGDGHFEASTNKTGTFVLVSQ